MTKEEATKYLQQLYPNEGNYWLDEQKIEAIGMAIEALQEESVSKQKLSNSSNIGKDCKEEPVSEEFKEVIEEYATNRLRDPELCMEYIYFELINAIKYGINLQKQQMMSKAIDGKVLINGMGNPILHLWDKSKHIIDKKVKVIILKED